MKSILLSHIGKRKINQDVILAKKLNPDTYVYLIADGMGGYDNGEIAASISIESIFSFLSDVDIIAEENIQKAINKANLAIRQFQEQHQSKLGATIGGVIISENVAKCFWVGDVKIMQFRKNKIIYESKSHNLINDVIESGSLSDGKNFSKYAHVLTRSIHGNIEKSKLSYKELDLLVEDILIVCSDGVHNLIDSDSLEYMVSEKSDFDNTIEKINQRLIVEASDNASLIAILYN